MVSPGRARRGASGSLNPQSAIAGPRTARGAESSGVWAGARSVDSQVPRIGSLRTASGPEGSSAKQCLPGAAEQPGSSKRRRRRPGDPHRRRPRDRAFLDSPWIAARADRTHAGTMRASLPAGPHVISPEVGAIAPSRRLLGISQQVTRQPATSTTGVRPIFDLGRFTYSKQTSAPPNREGGAASPTLARS
jgi:hypothetical protein